MTTLNRICAVALAALVGAPLAGHAAPAVAQVPVFKVTEVPIAGNAMNRAGHVVASGSGGVQLWNGTGVRQLAAAYPGYSDGLGINNVDDVAGVSYGNASAAFANIGGVVHNILAAAPDFRSSYARGINDHRWVVGALYEGRGGIESRPFIYRNGSVQLLPTLGGNNGTATAVSNRGHVTGWAGLPTTPPFTNGGEAFLYRNGKMLRLGTLSGDDGSSGLDVNDRGEVIGTSHGQAGSRGFLYSRGRMTDIGNLGGRDTTAFAINNAGVAVGESQLADGSRHGFIYARGRMIDLNRLLDRQAGWEIVTGLDINDAFQVLCRACRTDGSGCGTVRLEPPVGPHGPHLTDPVAEALSR